MSNMKKNFSPFEVVKKNLINKISKRFLFVIFFVVGWIINFISVVLAVSSENVEKFGDITNSTAFQIGGIFFPPVGSVSGWVFLFV